MEETKQEPDRSEWSRKESPAILSLFFGFCLMLAGLSLVYVAQTEIVEGMVQSTDYHRAPGCTTTAVASSGLPPCQIQTMTITAKDRIDGGDGPDTYKLGLRLLGGPEQEVTLVGPDKADLFVHVAIGGSVQAKMWQGDILILSIPGWHCGKPNHPDAQVNAGEMSLAAGGLCTLLGGCGVFYGWRAYKRQKSPQSLEETT